MGVNELGLMALVVMNQTNGALLFLRDSQDADFL
jgi:hypothetical protein